MHDHSRFQSSVAVLLMQAPADGNHMEDYEALTQACHFPERLAFLLHERSCGSACNPCGAC